MAWSNVFAQVSTMWEETVSFCMAIEATSLGLEVNWQKTKVQALGSRENEPLTITVQGQEVAVVEEFVYLGSLCKFPLCGRKQLVSAWQ